MWTGCDSRSTTSIRKAITTTITQDSTPRKMKNGVYMPESNSHVAKSVSPSEIACTKPRPH
jgi:hypothetical protein